MQADTAWMKHLMPEIMILFPMRRCTVDPDVESQMEKLMAHIVAFGEDLETLTGPVRLKRGA